MRKSDRKTMVGCDQRSVGTSTGGNGKSSNGNGSVHIDLPSFTSISTLCEVRVRGVVTQTESKMLYPASVLFLKPRDAPLLPQYK